MANSLVTVVEKKAPIYIGESFFMDVERQDGLEFDDTNSFEVEVLDFNGSIVDTETMLRSVAKTEFEIRYLNTSSWIKGKKYNLRGRLKDSVSMLNDVVIDIEFTVR